MTAHTVAVPKAALSKSERSSFQQVHCVGKGGVEKLTVVAGHPKVPGAHEIAIRVEFAGVCFADIAVRLGMYTVITAYPFVPGY